MLFKSHKGRSDHDGVRPLWASTGLEEVYLEKWWDPVGERVREVSLRRSMWQETSGGEERIKQEKGSPGREPTAWRE